SNGLKSTPIRSAYQMAEVRMHASIACCRCASNGPFTIQTVTGIWMRFWNVMSNVSSALVQAMFICLGGRSFVNAVASFKLGAVAELMLANAAEVVVVVTELSCQLVPPFWPSSITPIG